ncbi:hypothetical protein Aperf_G00000015638 [Anoplocephala perfoliata]
MKPKSTEQELLRSICPQSLDPFTLEPLNSLAFLDPLISTENVSFNKAQPPISFPDLSLPLICFDAHVPRNFDTGECVEGDVDCAFSGNIFATDAPGQDGSTSITSFAIDDICRSLSSLWNESEGNTALKDGFAHPPLKSPESIVEEYLNLCSVEFLPPPAEASSQSESTETKKEETGTEKKGRLDPEIQATLEMRLRQSKNIEIRTHSVLETTNEKLPPLQELVPDPAFEWPFELDTFQKQAIICLENNQSVLVAAHTSAGKTVVAEYACAMCKRRGSRAIYTSPIKALSNQKFRDFRRTFGEDVGLLTGDIKVATKSSILVMTTEILHNMLCNSADTIRDLEVVIMDEVHYMNDKERGHVWEQLMILLPQYVILVLLSATLPNAMEFADWLGRIRGGTTIHVCQTNERPVPLEHYLYTGCDSATRENTYLIVDKSGHFCREAVSIASARFAPLSLPHSALGLILTLQLDVVGYFEAKQSLTKPKKVKKKADVSDTITSPPDEEEIARKEAKKKPKSQYTGGKTDAPGRRNYMPKGDSEAYNRNTKAATTVWLGLIRMLREHELMPVIVFCFSRARINNLVQCLDSVDLLNKLEKHEVTVFLRSAVGSRLKGSDKLLKQVLLVRSLAVRGIAIHHAGMLPLLKEAVEMLFQRGLVRILFATETFAMGVNMPARCVVFTSIQKHDGTQRRPLTAGLASSKTESHFLVNPLTGIIVDRFLESSSTGTRFEVESRFPLDREYTQMAGRAGRRGLDTTGTVIIIANNCDKSVLPTDLELQKMLLGQATKLSSRFKITYSMILYLHRGELQTPQELIHQSFMHASDLRLEMVWKRQLGLIREVIKSSVIDNSPSFNPRLTKTGPVTSIHGSPDNKRYLSVDTRCPAYPLDSVKATKALCIDQMASFYTACHCWREMSRDCSKLAGDLPVSMVSKVFCPGRVVQLQLSPESIRRAVENMSGGSLSSYDGPGCIPNWITLGVVLEVSKVVGMYTLTVVTWQLPPSPVADCSKKIGATPEEEDILIDEEPPEIRLTPFPPSMMPKYCPDSKEESKSRLIIVNGVPLSSVLGVSNTVVNGATDDKSFGETVCRDLEWFRQQQKASAEGLQVVIQKRRGGGDLNEARKKFMQRPLDAVNETLHSVATNLVAFESIPFWMHMGLECPEVDKWMELSDALQSLQSTGDECSTYFDMAVCEDPVAHLSLAHRHLRRAQAVSRLEAKLDRNQDILLIDYEARVRVLEELGFLEKDSGSGCLTRKGRAACEFQQMEVLLAEVLFDGSIIQMAPEDIAALLSCFACESGMGGQRNLPTIPSSPTANNPPGPHIVFDAKKALKTSTAPKDPEELIQLPATVPEHLEKTVRSMFVKAQQLERLQLEFGVLEGEPDVRLNAVLVGAAYAWACHQPFSAVVAITPAEVAEGHVLRALQRLDELLRHVCAACRGLGDQTLASRIEAASVAVHRDMVCAPSLYVADEIAPENFSESKDEDECA